MSRRGGPRREELKAQSFEAIERNLGLRINAERVRNRAAPLTLLHRSDRYSEKQDLIQNSVKAMNSVLRSSIADIDISRLVTTKRDGSYEMGPTSALVREFGPKTPDIIKHSKSLLTLYKVFSDKEKAKTVTSDPAFWQSLVVNSDVAAGFLGKNKEFILNAATSASKKDPTVSEMAPFALETFLPLVESTLTNLSNSRITDPLQLGESIAKIYNKASAGEYFDSDGRIKKREAPSTNIVDDLVEFAGPMVGGAILSEATKKEHLDAIFDFAGYANIMKKKAITLSGMSAMQKQAAKEDVDFTTEVIVGVKGVIGGLLDDTRTIRSGFFEELETNPEVRDKFTDLLNARSSAEVLQSFNEFKKASPVISEIFEMDSEPSRKLSESLAKAATTALGGGEYKEVAAASMPLLLGIVANLASGDDKKGIEDAVNSTIRNAGLVMADSEYLRANRRNPHQVDERAIKNIMAEDQRNMASSIVSLLSTEENKRMFREVLPEVISKNREAFVAVFNNIIEQNTPKGKPRLVSGREIVDMLSNRGTVEKIIGIADTYLNQAQKGLRKKVIEVLQDTPHTKAIAKRAMWHGVKSFCKRIYFSVVKRLFGTKISIPGDTSESSIAGSLSVQKPDLGKAAPVEKPLVESLQVSERRRDGEGHAIREAVSKKAEHGTSAISNRGAVVTQKPKREIMRS